MEPVWFRWNDDTAKLESIDAYFLPGGFSYEDRGRSGMVAARDPLLEFIGQEAASGKVVIGNCNGAQVLVESGLIPLGNGLKMSLARNSIQEDGHSKAQGFLNERVWMKSSAGADRCATSNWTAPMHIPIAHGEGRFITTDPDVLAALQENNQLAFVYCDEVGNASENTDVTPNGSIFGAAGICNPEGNVVALMPHPERTPNGQPYFISLKQWLENNKQTPVKISKEGGSWTLQNKKPASLEIFIQATITNNEERTVESVAKRHAPNLRLTQLRYYGLQSNDPKVILSHLAHFNPNKEIAYVRSGNTVSMWNSDTEQLETIESSPLQEKGIKLLRRDVPDAAGESLEADTGLCYVCENMSEEETQNTQLLEVFANPHASTLEVLQ